MAAIFSDDLIDFLESLSRNNRRDWFQAQKPRYETSVLMPSLQLIEHVHQGLRRHTKHFPGIAKRSGGSLMRIYRDTRFSKEKTPYKTNVGIHFRHSLSAGDVHAVGYYIHIEPGECFLGVGCWRPPSDDLRAIRQAIVDQSTQWKRATGDVSFKRHYKLAGEQLKTAPRDYPKDHPLIDDLRRKDFVGLGPLAESSLTRGDLADQIVERFAAAKGMMKFLCKAFGIPF
jgi:uncharacterized protein (TIGR02453 family)